MKNTILLSICIPTFNRAEYLEKTLLSIIGQKRFQQTENVEIVISDNCSGDSTAEVCRKFMELYGNKIKYYRNPVNVISENVRLALSRANGLFLKLNNDTLVHRPNSLETIISLINQKSGSKDILFFSNATIPNLSECSCNDLDSFVKTVSYHSTWIGSFGIWKDDFAKAENFDTVPKIDLINEVLFSQILNRGSVWIDNSKLFDSLPPASKGGYNIYRVFVGNYLGLLEKYKDINQISPATLFNEKSRLLIKFIIPWFVNIWKERARYHFDQTSGLSIVFRKYWAHPALYFGVFYLAFRLVQHSMRQICGTGFVKPNATI